MTTTTTFDALGTSKTMPSICGPPGAMRDPVASNEAKVARQARMGSQTAAPTLRDRTAPPAHERPTIPPLLDYLRLADRAWPVLAPLMRGHARVYRATGGLVGGSVPGLPPMLLLDHVGAKSGKRRTTPLVYMPEGHAYVVVASKGGYPNHPGWVHNLRAHPETAIQIGRRRIAVRAREAAAAERKELWPRAVRHNPVWGRYQQRTQREIPLVILEPRGG